MIKSFYKKNVLICFGAFALVVIGVTLDRYIIESTNKDWLLPNRLNTCENIVIENKLDVFDEMQIAKEESPLAIL